MGITTNLADVIRDLEVAKGEVEFVHDAVLRDLSEAALDSVKAAWPVASGDSLRGWTLEHPEPLRWVIENPVDYTSYVWANRKKKGPPVSDLWLKLVVRAVDEVAGEWEELVSDRVVELLVMP